jgi:flagellar hook-basal body complex protein FliE
MPIDPINPSLISALRQTDATSKSSASGNVSEITESFGDMLAGLDESQQNADSLIEMLARGEDVDLHTVMIGLEENNIRFNVAMGVRDKLVEAYREIMRMQV